MRSQMVKISPAPRLHLGVEGSAGFLKGMPDRGADVALQAGQVLEVALAKFAAVEQTTSHFLGQLFMISVKTKIREPNKLQMINVRVFFSVFS